MVKSTELASPSSSLSCTESRADIRIRLVNRPGRTRTGTAKLRSQTRESEKARKVAGLDWESIGTDIERERGKNMRWTDGEWRNWM